MRIKPTQGNVLICPRALPERVGSIFIVPHAKYEPEQGFIVAIGEPKKNQPVHFKVGDTVQFNRYQFEKIEDYVIGPSDQVECIIK